MKLSVNMIIEQEKEPGVEVHSFSDGHKGIYITAPDTEKALELLKTGQQMECTEEPNTEKVSKDERELIEFINTPAGARFEKGVNNAVEFTRKKDKKPFYCSQARYFALVARTEGVFDAIIKLYCYAFRKGYNSAKKAA